MEIPSTHPIPDNLNPTTARTQASQLAPEFQTSSCSTHFVRRIIMAIILLFITLSSITVVASFFLHPHSPVFHVDSLVVSNFNLSNSHLNSNYELNLTIRNPNQKLNVSFESAVISISYHKFRLSETSIKSFELGKMRQTMVSAMLRTDSGFSLHEKIAKDMDGDLSKRLVSFDITISVKAKYKSKNWPSKQTGMKVSCQNLIVKFKYAKTVGMFDRRNTDCFVHLL